MTRLRMWWRRRQWRRTAARDRQASASGANLPSDGPALIHPGDHDGPRPGENWLQFVERIQN